MSRRRIRLVRFCAGVVSCLLVLAALLLPVGAAVVVALVLTDSPLATPPEPRPAAPGERVERLAVSLHVDREGELIVRESYDYAFGSAASRSFVRRLDHASEGLADVRARGERGSTARIARQDGTTEVRVTAPAGARWAGTHRFVIAYRLREPRDHGDNGFAFGAIEDDWRVPVRRFEATVTGDVGLRYVGCQVRTFTTPCEHETRVSGRRFELTQAPVPAATGVTVAGQYDGPAGSDAGDWRRLAVAVAVAAVVAGIAGVLLKVAFSVMARLERRVERYLSRSPRGGGARAAASAARPTGPVYSTPDRPDADLTGGATGNMPGGGAGGVGSG